MLSFETLLCTLTMVRAVQMYQPSPLSLPQRTTTCRCSRAWFFNVFFAVSFKLPLFSPCPWTHLHSTESLRIPHLLSRVALAPVRAPSRFSKPYSDLSIPVLKWTLLGCPSDFQWPWPVSSPIGSSSCPRNQSGYKPIQTANRAVTEMRSRLRCPIPRENPQSRRIDTVWDGAVEEHAREEPSEWNHRAVQWIWTAF